MSHNTTASLPSYFRTSKPKTSVAAQIAQLLRLIFIAGPKVLINSQISGLCATAMILMCMPSFILCSMMTIPEMVFRSPDQHAYYYFAQLLNQDPTRWVVLALAAMCTLFSLALPATMPAKRMPLSY